MLDLKQINTEDRKPIAFQLVVAMRDALNLAKKKGSKPTYENTIRLFHDFSPELYHDIVSALPQRNMSEDAKVYIARAQVESKENETPVEAIDLLKADIDTYRAVLLQANRNDIEQTKTLRNKVSSLESLKKSLRPRTLTENRILIRDTSRANREDFGAQFFRSNDFFIDYVLTDHKFLRIRLLHPDIQEHMTGADLIYEQHDENTGLIRIVLLQYKIWENGVLYFSQAKNLVKQLQKLKKCTCDLGHCSPPSPANMAVDFRFPYCAAFLRPTDKLQDQNEKLVSSGIHIPICLIDKATLADGKLERKSLRYETLNHELFEELFNRGFIGSRWMSETEMEAYYKANKILESDDSVIFYAREVNSFTGQSAVDLGR
jgi:hypothetical protein